MPRPARNRRVNAVAAIVAYLERREIACALIGGTALGVHGIARATLDVDLLIVDGAVLDPEFWRGLRGVAPPEIRRGDVDDVFRGVVRFSPPRAPIDVIVGKGSWLERILDRRVRARVLGRRIPTVDAADLVLLKLFAGGPQDLLDVELLLGGRGAELREQVDARLPGTPPSLRSAWRKMKPR